MSQQKRKRVVPTIQEKIDIIKQLDEGISVKELALKYNIGSTTVHDVKKNRDKLLRFSIATTDSIFGIQSRRTMKKSPYELLHKAMLQWFNRERAEGRPVNGPMCVKQAKIMFETLGLKGNFDASSGWLARFKDRHGIRTVGDSMDCLWTKINTEKLLKSDESNQGENSPQEENSLNASTQSSTKNSDKNDEIAENDKSLETPVQTTNVEDASSQPAPTSNSEEKILEENVIDNQSSSASKNNINLTDLNSVVKKLEVISEKLTTSDSYDQFGTYITSLLRRLPQNKALTLKQKIVNDVLDAIVAHEKGLDESSLINFSFNRSANNESSADKLQSSKKRPLTAPCVQCSPSKRSAEPANNVLLPDNISPSRGRTASKKVRSSVTNSSQEKRNTVNDSNNESFETFNRSVGVDGSDVACRGLKWKMRLRAKPRKAPKKRTTYVSSSTTTSDVEDSPSVVNPISPAEDFKIDIEEGVQLGELKENREMFEAVFCEDNLFVQVKDEPREPEPDPEDSLGAAQSLLCDLCEIPCTSSTELVLHFTQVHPGCVPTCRAQFEGNLT